MMVKDWLQEQGIIVTEEGGKVNFSFNNARYSVEKESVENADIHKSISMFDQITQALGMNK